MNLSRALEKAQGTRGPKEAARLYSDIESELAFTSDEDHYEQGEQALRHLEQHYPGVADEAHQIDTPPKLSPKAKDNAYGDKHPLEAKPREQHEAEKRQPGRGLRQRAASATTIHARRRGGGWGGRRFAQTGIPAAGESVAQLTMKTIGGIAGLSFLYLLLTPRGSAAVSTASTGGVHALRALVSPNVDPLRATASAQAAAVTPGRPLGQQYPGLQSAINGVDNALNQFQAHAGTGASKPRPVTAAAGVANKAAAGAVNKVVGGL